MENRTNGSEGELKRVKVLLADDHAMFLEGLVKTLESHCQIVGSVHDGRALVEEAARLRPDVIILDISMPSLNGIDAILQLKKQGILGKVIVLTMHQDATFAAEAFRAGASAFLLKSCIVRELLEAIQVVLRGQVYITPLIAKEAVGLLLEQSARNHAAAGGGPTARQREVLQLLAEGHSMKEIAHALGISLSTAEFHKSSAMQRLGLRSTAELVKYAIAHGLTNL